MINTTIILNYSMNLSQSLSKCSIDQYEMMKQVQRTPIIAYYLLLIIFIFLTALIFFPALQEKLKFKQIIFPIYILLFTALSFYSFTTFNISAEFFKTKIEPILYIISGIGILYIIWKERNKIEGIFKK